MADSIGYKTIMGTKLESGYRSAIEVTEKLLLRSESINFENENLLHDYLEGNASIPTWQRAFEPVVGSVEIDIPYTKLTSSEFVSGTTLIAAAMGVVTYNAGQGSNEITMQDDLSKFITLAWDKDVHATRVWEAVSCYMNSMVLSSEAGQPLKATFDIQAYDLIIPGVASSTNTVSDLTSLPVDLPNLVMFDDFIFRIGDHGGILGDGDRIGISSFTITLNNNLTDPGQTTIDNTASHTDILQPIQPKRNGFREVTLEVVIPRYNADTFHVFQANDTPLQCDLLSTGPSSEEFDIIFPNLKVMSVETNVAGPEVVQQTLTFRCFKWVATSDMTFSEGDAVDSADPEFNSELWVETDDERVSAIF